MNLNNQTAAQLITAMLEVQSNAGRMMTLRSSVNSQVTQGEPEFIKGIPLKVDYDLSKAIKLISKKAQEITNDMVDFGQKKGVTFNQNGYKLPDDASDELKTEFAEMYEKAIKQILKLTYVKFLLHSLTVLFLRTAQTKMPSSI